MNPGVKPRAAAWLQIAPRVLAHGLGPGRQEAPNKRGEIIRPHDSFGRARGDLDGGRMVEIRDVIILLPVFRASGRKYPAEAGLWIRSCALACDCAQRE